MKTLRFTDPSNNYTGFKDVHVKVDAESLNSDNCTVYEVYSEDLPFSIEIGLDIPTPWVTTIQYLKELARSLGLVLSSVEDNIILMGDSIILSHFTAHEYGGTDGEVASLGIVLTFDKPILGLTTQSVKIEGATLVNVGAPAPGNLEWTLQISDLVIPNKENLLISIDKWSVGSVVYGAIGNAVAEVYNLPIVEVTYSAVQSGGKVADEFGDLTSSTGIDITLPLGVASFTADLITLDGATKGELTDNGNDNFTLAISDITVPNLSNVLLTIADSWVDSGNLIIVTTKQPTPVLVYKAV